MAVNLFSTLARSRPPIHRLIVVLFTLAVLLLVAVPANHGREADQIVKICGPNITAVIIRHLNEVISQPQGNLNPLWPFGASELTDFARRNARKIRAEADKVTGCPAGEDCTGTYTMNGKCISGYHIDHILIMVYIEASYGAKTARSAGQYNESFSLGAWNEGSSFEGSGDEISDADLNFNELAICLGQQMKHADENNGATDTLTEQEVNDCFSKADMDKIGKKPRPGGGSGGTYKNCALCTIPASFPPDLELPPVDL